MQAWSQLVLFLLNDQENTYKYIHISKLYDNMIRRDCIYSILGVYF